MQFTIRKANIKDFQEVHRLNQALFDEEYANGHDDLLDLTWPDSQEGLKHYQRVLKNPHYRTLVAEDETGKIVGYVTGTTKNKFTWRKVPTGELEELFVERHARGNGIATQLVQQLKTWLKESGIKRIYVSAYFKNKKAHAFYATVGFVPIDSAFDQEI